MVRSDTGTPVICSDTRTPVCFVLIQEHLCVLF